MRRVASYQRKIVTRGIRGLFQAADRSKPVRTFIGVFSRPMRRRIVPVSIFNFSLLNWALVHRSSFVISLVSAVLQELQYSYLYIQVGQPAH